MGWLIALGILILLGCMPLGVSAVYDAGGFVAKLLAGPVKIPLFPREKKEKPKPAKEEESQAPVTQDKAQPAEKKGGSFQEFLPLVKIATDFLGDLRRKLRVKRLEMKLCMAGGDPCDLGINYGRAWAAVGNLIPQLERLFVIKKRDVQVLCDFTQSQTTLYVRADITITLARFLCLVVRYGWRGYKEYKKIINKRKGGAVK